MTSASDRLSAALADRYVIEREVGAGGMATVYLAEDLKHKRKVALKVLKPELAAVLGAERFVVEITTTASLSHPHILPLFDSGTADGFLYYVMPFVEGETLRDKLNRETQLGVDEAVKIASEVADALDYAHRHGVIHRDIKPENILLHDGRPMVADFGIALAVSAAAGGRMTETGLSLGTPHYMSPEQATAEKEITARSDVYSLASVLYEMLAGEPPHSGGSAQAIIMKIIAEPAQAVTKYRKSVPPNVAAAVAKALEKVPADRFESAKAFHEALANPSFSSGATAAGALAAAGPSGGRVRVRTVALAVTAALVLGVAGARLLWPVREESAGTSRLMLEFPANQQPRVPSQLWPTLALLPNGNGLLYSGPGANTRTQLWVRSWDRLNGTRIPQTQDDGCCAVFSPRGDSLAYLMQPHQLIVVPLSGGVPRTVADSGLTAVTDWGGGVDWGSDGFLYASGVEGLIRVSPRGGVYERVSTLDTVRGDLRHMWPAVLPGARRALVTVVPIKDPVNPERASIGVVDFSTRKVEVILQGGRAWYAPTGHVLFVKANGVLWAAPFDAASGRLTGGERELVDTLALNLGTPDGALSPDGTFTYSKGVVQSFQVVVVDRNGESRPLSADLRDVSLDGVGLSPDGKRIAVSMGGLDGKLSVWLKPLDGTPRSRLTFDGNTNVNATWRPGTGAITFTSDREGAGQPSRVFERAASGTGGISRPLLFDDRPVGGLNWSPDGKWLLFRTDDQAAGNGDIMGVRPGVDTVARALVATPAEEFSPAVSFDGRWLAYSSNESGRREVYVRPFPNASEGRYQVSTVGGISPVWNPNGRELFYVDGEGNMVAVPVTGGATFETGQPRALFSAQRYQQNPFRRWYDLMPDGQRFVMIRGESDAAMHVVVVFNFLEELKRRMASP